MDLNQAANDINENEFMPLHRVVSPSNTSFLGQVPYSYKDNIFNTKTKDASATIGINEFRSISDSNPFAAQRRVYIEKKSYGLIPTIRD